MIERSADYRLRLTVGVRVRCLPSIEADVVSFLQQGKRFFLGHHPRAAFPVWIAESHASKYDLRDFEAAAAKSLVLHGRNRRRFFRLLAFQNHVDVDDVNAEDTGAIGEQALDDVVPLLSPRSLAAPWQVRRSEARRYTSASAETCRFSSEVPSVLTDSGCHTGSFEISNKSIDCSFQSVFYSRICD